MAVDPLILHADLDAFFASVEILDNPRLAGQPVVVGADPQQGRGVVSACSYEARRYGVHSAMPIREARRRCPHAVFLPVRMSRYKELSGRVFGVFAGFSPVVEPLSIDEAFLDIAGMRQLFGSPEEIAAALRRAVREACGLAVSVGISRKKFIAKIASDLAKPDGCLVVTPGDESRFLHPLPVSRLWGVGKVLGESLNRLGIETIGQLASWPEADLAARFGENGRSLFRLAHGEDDRSVAPPGDPLSFSREQTFASDLADGALLQKKLRAMALEIATDLLSHGLEASTVSVKLRSPQFKTILRSRSLRDPVADDRILFAVALDLFRANWEGSPLRLLGMGVKNFSPPGRQALLLESIPEAVPGGLAAVCHRIRTRFGSESLLPATLLKTPEDAGRAAPGFRKMEGEGRP